METGKRQVKLLSMIMDGHKLEIITERIGEGEWALCVENIHGVRSVWFECFESADAALEAGRSAIQTEGVEEFFCMDGFEYLF